MHEIMHAQGKKKEKRKRQVHYSSALYVLVNNREAILEMKQLSRFKMNTTPPPPPPPPCKPAHGNVICMPLNNESLRGVPSDGILNAMHSLF